MTNNIAQCSATFRRRARGAGIRLRPRNCERQLMKQLNYLLYRWFVGFKMDDPVWNVTVFTKNRERAAEG